MKKQEPNNAFINEKLDEAFLFSIGREHASNVVKYVESLSENQNEALYPTSLDDWFDDFIGKYEYKKDSQVHVQNIHKVMKKFTRDFFRRVAIVLIGIIVVTSLLSLGSDAFRTNIMDLFIKTTQKFSEVSHDDSIQNADFIVELPDNWSGYYPSVLPSEYEFENSLDSSAGKYLVFVNDMKEELIFIQGPQGMKVLVDSEDAVSYAVDVNGLEGMIYEKSDLVTLLWNDNSTCFYLIGEVDKETIVKIASSMKYKK